MTDNDKPRLTTREWVLLLVLLAMVQFLIHASAFVYCGRGSALTYWSLVGTSVSIILALLAIIWSFIQNLIQQQGSASIAAQIERLQSVVMDASKSGAQFNSQIERLDEVRGQLQETASLTRQSRDDIMTMGKRVEATQKLVEDLSQKPQPIQQPSTTAAKPVSPDFSGFFTRCSLSGALVIYACYLSNKNKVAFDLAKLCGVMKHVEKMYAHGYLVASSSAGIIGYTESQGVWNITEFAQSVAKDIRQALLEKISTFQEKSPNLAADFTKSVETVETMLTE